MRLRLFTLLLVPIIALLVMGYVVLADRQSAVEDAALASDSAALAVQLADLDKALGAEALATTEYLDDKISWTQLATGQFADTDFQVAKIQQSDFELSVESEVPAAMDEIQEALSVRAGIEEQSVTQLHVVIRYSRLRGLLIDALASELGTRATSANSKDLLVLIALVEARSAHLNERIAVDLAIESGSWPTGQRAAAIQAVATHDNDLRFANNNRLEGFEELEISNTLDSIRSTVRFSSAPPAISVERWKLVSDNWSLALEAEIEAIVDQMTATLRATQESEGDVLSITLLLIAVTVLVAFSVAALVAVRIVRRVQVIAAKAASLATGDSGDSSLASTIVGGNDEIADLADAFDNMAREIAIREEALEIESTVLEGIANGEPIEPTLSTIEWLLGTDDGERAYRFTNLATSPDAVPTNEVADGYTPLYLEPVGSRPPVKEPYSSRVRSAMSLAALAQRRADDNAMLHRRATRDPLTGVLNRRAVIESGEEWIEQARETNTPYPALIFADLDGFKKVNDSHGHAVGDQVLITSSERMQRVVEGLGGNVGRVGGDEFVVIVSGIDGVERLSEVCQLVVDQVLEPIDAGAERVKVGVSIGAVLGRPDASMAALISEADEALYAAKNGGRGQIVVSDPAFREVAEETALLTERVVDALAKEEFVPWFQPVWSDNGTQIAAFEALVRWKSPEGRTLSPGQFLPILEQQNLIGALDALMFRKVCFVLAEWMNAGKPLIPMHLNVSPSRIENLNFVEETKEILSQTGIPPELIIVEVTESDLMTDITQNARRLQELRDLGVLIAADDFGTGYSSLAYLRDLPVDILKIDRQFISEIDKSPSNIKIVSALISLAQSLGLSVVAEGVEREEELAVLNQHGCHYIQGFLLGKPLPRPETESLLGRHASNVSSELADRLPTIPVDMDQTVLDKHFDALRDHLAEYGDRLGDAPVRWL